MATNQLNARLGGVEPVELDVLEGWGAVPADELFVPPPQAAQRSSVAVAASSSLDIPVSIARPAVVIRVGVAGVGALRDA